MNNFFKLKEHGTTVRREVAAGLTTFLTMAYILAVNPGMLSAIGGEVTFGAVFTATVVSAVIATVIMALAANLPVALAPGMGLNAFFTFTVVLGMGVSWKTALLAVFLEGLLFVILSFFNVREAIIDAIPTNLKKAVAVGIGLFIAFIGMQNAGIIVNNDATLLGLGEITHGPALLAFIGLAIIGVLLAFKVPGAILIGILVTTIVGIPMGVTVVPKGFSPFSAPEAPLFFQFGFQGNLSFGENMSMIAKTVFSFEFFVVFFTFLFVDIFDTVGTLVGVATQGKLMGANGKIPRVKQALLADAIGTMAGACLGTSTVTSYVESSAGVAAGGRTGLTALTTAGFFALSIFLSPLFLLIPSAATAPALIAVGFFMIGNVVEIKFADPTDGIPAFLAIIMMPFAYSIAEGITFGIVSYVLLKALGGKFKDISIVTWILAIIFVFKIVLG